MLIDTLSKVKNYNAQQKHYEAPYLTIEDMENIEYALDKQTPKPLDTSCKCDEKKYFKCPTCGRIMVCKFTDGGETGSRFKYCPSCGQNLDWSD